MFFFFFLEGNVCLTFFCLGVRLISKDQLETCFEVVDFLKVKLPHKNSGFRLEGKAERNPPA